MARDHAQIRLSIWDDDDFRSLPGHAQHLYWMLLIHPELSYCGVLDWRPARLSGFVGDWTADDVRAAAQVLIERLYILVDQRTEEVLVRSFVRVDGLMKQPKMATAMATAHAAVGSVSLRGVVVWELQRLHREDPELKGWGSDKASALLSKPSVDPSAYPCGKGSGNPSGKGSGNPNEDPSKNPSGKASASPCSLLLAPDSSSPADADAPTDETPLTPKTTNRGTRIPDDFTIDDPLRAFGHDLGFTDQRLDQLTESFRDYWRAAPGQRGVKVDWPATWRNWVRREAQQRPPVAVGASATGLRPWEL